jgi:2-oxoglutarate ferredoxin oxidoreductase subunit beta
MTTQPPIAPALSKRDFVTDQDVRWCPGCGDYAILSAVQKVFPTLGIPKENFVIISGIGCSSRFPYYMNTYGFHTIHGRAPTIASGVKLSNPDLSVWVVTGDGDALSIGGNHLLHVLRRNVNLNILLFNNEIYGLTKGQTSPTSRLGKVTKSTPSGNCSRSVNPVAFALGANATFVARTVDIQAKHMVEMLRRAHEHQGTSFIEILQNCNIFNDGVFKDITDRKERLDRQLTLEHGKPLIFGINRDRGIRADGFRMEVVELGNGITEDDLLVHDETLGIGYAMALAEMSFPDFPTPIGVLRAVEAAPYEVSLNAQVEEARSRKTPDLQDLLDGPDTWDVH